MGFDCFGYRLGNFRVKGFRHNIGFTQLFVGNKACNSMGGSQFHFFGNLQGAPFQSPFENAGESNHIVDLVGEIAAACAYDFCAGFFGMISGTGFAIAKRMESLFMEATISFVTMPGADTPTKMSACFRASERVPVSPAGFVT